MRYSLITVYDESNGIVSGNWMQNCCTCNLEEATQRAISTEGVNGNKIKVAVVEELGYSPGYSFRRNMQRLDKRI